MEHNPLYPVFFKLHQVRVLVVGAGEVGYEKLSFLLKSSPDACVTIVAKAVRAEVWELIAQHAATAAIRVEERAFEAQDVAEAGLVIAATNDRTVNQAVYEAARQHRRLVNVADTPALCDFYLGAIVTKGNLKIAISTNGKSPTFAKRLRQWLEAVLPDEADDLLTRLRLVREGLKADFAEKVSVMSALTEAMLAKRTPPPTP